MVTRLSNRGAALIMVLIVLTIVMVAATAMVTKYNRARFLSYNSELKKVSTWYVDGIEGIIKKYMKDDFNKSPNKTHMGMLWAQPDQVIPLDDSIISGTVFDDEACFNINSIATDVSIEGKKTQDGFDDTDYRLLSQKYPAAVFKQLLLFMGSDDNQAQTIVDSMIDWIDPDAEMYSNLGAEDAFYSTSNYKHLTANGFFYDKSELRFIKGMNDDLYRKIEHLVCVLPNSQFKVNINMLYSKQAPLVSALLLGQMDVETAAEILNQRPQSGWENINDFLKLSEVSQVTNYINGINQRLNKVLSINSHFFHAVIKVKFQDNDSVYSYRTKFYRNDSNRIIVYQRVMGEFGE